MIVTKRKDDSHKVYKTLKELELIREKKDKPDSSGISFNVAKCKGGYGVYIKALSGPALIVLGFKFPEINVDLDETSPNYGKVYLNEVEYSGGVKVNSNRLMRGKNEGQCNEYIASLKALPMDQQWTKVSKFRMWLVNRDTTLVKCQYYQFYAGILGNDVKLFTTQNRALINQLSDGYIQAQTRHKVVPTVARTKRVPTVNMTEQYENGQIIPSILDGVETKPYKPVGIKGIMAPATTDTFLRRVGQKRKRTTKLSFFNKYR